MTHFYSVGKVWDSDVKSVFPVGIQSTGTMFWVVTTQFSTFCDFDMRLFPFDKQTCSITVRIVFI